MKACVWVVLFAVLLGSRARSAQAGSEADSTDQRPVYVLEPVKVRGRIDDLSGVAAAASEGRVGSEDFRTRPLMREGELLETVPGLMMTQHSGDGKANQMFLRGFNLDHGTDFSTKVEEMPVNMPTHGHGQGYTDLNFLVPELVDYVEYKKGVYYPEVGDFGSAGRASIHLPAALDEGFFKLETGAYGYSRAAGGVSDSLGPGALLVGGEVKAADGAWDLPENLRKWSALGRYSWTAGRDEFSVLAMGYRNRWDSSDQIPARALDDIGRFGQVDSTLGGETHRHSLSVSWRRSGGASAQRAGVYGIAYDLDLFSNFTYLLEDSVNGDQIHQEDRRWIAGGWYRREQSADALGRSHLLRLGVDSRLDRIGTVALRHTRARESVSTVREDEVVEWGTGLWGSATTAWSDKVRTTAGLRIDALVFDVTSRTLAENSGSGSDVLVTPKLSIVAGPWSGLECYLDAGLGYHSNDVRGAVIQRDPVSGESVNRVDPLVASRGAEIGFRGTRFGAWRPTLAFWGLGLESELVFVGDAGATEPSAGSRRYGVEMTNFFRFSESVSADLDLAFSHARFLDVPEGEDRIPGALEQVVTAGVAWEGVHGFDGAIRLRYFGSYPLVEDNARRAEETALVNLGLGYRVGRVRLGVSVLNLLDSDDNDIQYAYASRLAGEPPEGVEDVHLHPVEPRQARVALSFGL